MARHDVTTCGAAGPNGSRCYYAPDHAGDHEGAVRWPVALDEAPTAKLPPIGTTVRRRPPVPMPPEVRELNRADLLRMIADELSGDVEDES